jgi:hypothetical protein
MARLSRRTRLEFETFKFGISAIRTEWFAAESQPGGEPAIDFD